MAIDLSTAKIVDGATDYPAKHNTAMDVIQAAVNGALTEVSANIADINTVAGIAADVTAVAGNNADVTTVADNIVDVGVVADAAPNMAIVVANLTDIQNAEENAVLAETARDSAINNALSAATSASIAADPTAYIAALAASYALTTILAATFFEDTSGEFKKVQAAYLSETKPTGRYLGQHSSAANAWAAAYLGVASANEDWYFNSTDKFWYKLSGGTSHTRIYRAGSTHLPRKGVALVSGTSTSSRLIILDLTESRATLWAEATAGASTLFGASGSPSFTTCKMAWSGLKLVYGKVGTAGISLGLVDFATGKAFIFSNTNHTTFAGDWSTRNSALSSKQVNATSTISNSNISDVAVGASGNIYVATEGGVSVVKPDFTTLKSSSTNAYKSVAILRGRLYAINDTASPESLIDFGPIDQLTASFAAVNTWTNATVPALSDSTLTKVVAAGDHLVIHGSTAVDELWPDTTTMANSLIARKYTTAATVPMKKPELMILAGTGTGSLVATDKVTNGGFASDITGWVESDPSGAGSVVWDTGAALVTKTLSNNMGFYSVGISVVAGETYRFTGAVEYVSGTFTASVGLRTTDNVSTAATIGSSVSIVQSGAGTTSFDFSVTATSTGTAYFGLHAFTTSGAAKLDDVTGELVVKDHSGKSNHATINGTLTLTAHATGGVAMASGLSETNHLDAPNPWAGVGSGEAYICGVFKCAASAVNERLFSIGYWDGAAYQNAVVVASLVDSTGAISLFLSNDASATNVTATTNSAYDDTLLHTFVAKKTSTHYLLEVDGKEAASVAVGAHGTLTFHASATIKIGTNGALAASAPNTSVALIGGGKTALTASESAEIHKYLRNLVEGKAAFDELPSNLAYNELTDTIHCVGTTYEQTMRDGRVAVVGSHGVGTTPVIACGPGGEVSYGGGTNVTISVPERNLHEAENPPIYEEKMFYDEELTLEGTVYWLPVGWEVVSVKLDGAESRKNKGSAVYGWALQQDAFRWGVDPTAAITTIAVVAGRYV